jgi:hypothetical protein
MDLIRRLLFGALHLPWAAARLTGRGPFGPDAARPAAHGGTTAPSALKAALWRHHVRQFNEAACSVATVASVVNAIREVQGHSGPPLDQGQILRRVPTAHWRQRMQPGGHEGRRGLPLPLLGRVVRDSLDLLEVRYRIVDTVAAGKPVGAPARRFRSTLRGRLRRFETRGDALVIAHFDQGALLPVLNIPHISPVGGFDAATEAVTILDVDRDQPLPYQVPMAAFHRSLSSRYHHLFRPFGYDRGGYVYIRLP